MIGRTICQYRILSRLGAGGMGVVYEAEDLRLRRRVALKFLPAEMEHTPTAVERFQREAQAASALNHPHICTIYTVDEFVEDGRARHFIAMELLEGPTLDRIIGGHSLTLARLLDIAIDISDALEAAHGKGIIHRDIKPSNILVTFGGAAKVMDFGLAKLTGEPTTTPELEQPTMGTAVAAAPAHLTSPGAAVGTVAYMSPEQALGESLDARSDIFSLGAVLYEMACGQQPFRGNTSAAIFDAILHKAPVSPVRLNPELPADLERIVNKCLDKDRRMRYQSATELRTDLKRLKRNSDSDRISLAAVTSEAAMSSASQAVTTPPSSSQVILGELKRHKAGVATAVVLLLLLAAGASYGIFSALRKGNAAPKTLEITRLTNLGTSLGAINISPDGKYVAYRALEADSRASLWLRQVGTGSNLRLVPPGDGDFSGTTFSPDGEYIYYIYVVGLSGSSLLRLPVLGGQPVEVARNVSNIAFSPDGKRIAYVRFGNGPEQTLCTANPDFSDEKVLARAGLAEQTAFSPEGGPSWSPDGRMIVTGYGEILPSGAEFNLTLYDASTGKVLPFAKHKFFLIFRATWLPDGSGVIFNARETGNTSSSKIWFAGYPGGEYRRITNDLNSYGSYSLGISADGSTLVNVQEAFAGNLWVVPVQGNGIGKAITVGEGQNGVAGLRWFAKGRLLYTSDEGGTQQLWISDMDGTNRRKMTSGFDEVSSPAPYSEPTIYCLALKGKEAGVFRLAQDGGDAKLVYPELTAGALDVSPDGKLLAYTSWATNLPVVKVVPAEKEGAPIFSLEKSMWARFSPDGKSLAYYDTTAGEIRIWSFETKTSRRVLSTPLTRVDWASDGRSIYYRRVEKGDANIYRLSLGTGKSEQITRWHDENRVIDHFAVSPDGKFIAASRDFRRADVILLKNFH